MRTLYFFLFFSLLVLFGANAQDCGDRFLGTKTLYRYAAVKNTPPPTGYVPVFIDHIGRHGARHLTKEVSAEYPYRLLRRADSAGALSNEGKKLLIMVYALEKVEKGNVKSISEEGRQELKGLGERMFKQYPEVFAANAKLSVAITKEIRTKQSADAFLTGLKTKMKSAPVTEEYNDDTDLRFYDLSPAYKKFEQSQKVEDELAALARQKNVPAIYNALLNRVFDSRFSAKLTEEERAEFVSGIYGMVTIGHSLADEIKQAGFTADDLDFKSFFTCGQLAALGELDNAEEDLKKGPGTDVNGIQVRVAVPLLVSFIKSADEYSNSQKYNAALRFGHAETIAPFAALIGITVADKPTSDAGQIAESWKASEVIPLSANIQWIFYRKKNSQDYLVKILLNEKECHITGLGQESPYYKWSTLRDFYLQKLKQLGITFEADMTEYLKNLR